MSYDISQGTIDKATKCTKSLACLNGQDKPYCNVETFVSKEMVFVHCMNPEMCSYQRSFGYRHICTCPVRIAIWEKYHV